ncbi:hypothetical protein [Actinomadura sp. 7K534]|uniref:hypothetical protein n=1 Tax=Actinomadura sp. 7K534 TaxID=2530366 RepID=UPI00104BF69C|nr:hypothetical protein [Actinomadura sp. 7K534]TDB85583.1 hypothetical protein E1266_35355 [Actinomadura sp. 7K534]
MAQPRVAGHRVAELAFREVAQPRIAVVGGALVRVPEGLDGEAAPGLAEPQRRVRGEDAEPEEDGEQVGEALVVLAVRGDSSLGQEPDVAQLVRDHGHQIGGVGRLRHVEPDNRPAVSDVVVADGATPLAGRRRFLVRSVEQFHGERGPVDFHQLAHHPYRAVDLRRRPGEPAAPRFRFRFQQDDSPSGRPRAELTDEPAHRHFDPRLVRHTDRAIGAYLR